MTPVNEARREDHDRLDTRHTVEREEPGAAMHQAVDVIH